MIATIQSRRPDLSPRQWELVALAINSFGTGDHPYADDKTTPHFALDYAIECLHKASGALTIMQVAARNRRLVMQIGARKGQVEAILKVLG